MSNDEPLKKWPNLDYYHTPSRLKGGFLVLP
jgi:hypothetical protein